jgi:ATP-binding cassette subfamily B protein
VAAAPTTNERVPRDGRYVAFLRLLPLGGKGLLLTFTVVQLTLSAVPVAASIFNALLLGAVPAALREGSGGAAVRRMTVVLLLAVALNVGKTALTATGSFLQGRLARRVSAVVQTDLLEAVLSPVGITHLETQADLDRIDRARQLGAGRFNVHQGLMAVTELGRKWLGAGLAAVVVARWSVPIAVGLVVVHGLLNRWNNTVFRRLTATQAERSPDLRRSDALYGAGIGRDAAKEIRIFGTAGFLVDTYRDVWHAAMVPVWAARRGVNRGFVGASAIDALVTGGALLLAVRSGRHGDLSVTGVLLVVQNVIAVRGFSVLEAYGLIPDRPLGTIRFEDVGFSYPGAEAPVYEHLDLTIEPGRSLAVVGLNGAGKTTLVKLLTRMHDPDNGRITVGGIDVRAFDPAAWQPRVAAIFQDFTRFELNLADNVGFGAPRLADDREALADALDRAGIGDLVDELGLGWDTPLSPRLEGGVDLSGGQWQRVALARALLAVAGGAEVLVLDEPAAALDARAEAALVDRLLDVTKDLTTIVISHRFSTVRHCDRIVVIEGGTVVEDGDHASLVASGGRYAELFELQARKFRDAVPVDEVDAVEVAG